MITVPASVSDDGVTLTASFEGLGDGDMHTVALEPYFDLAGWATLARGHLLHDPQGHAIRTLSRTSHAEPAAIAAARAAVVRMFGTPAITLAQARTLLAQDMAEKAAAVHGLVAGFPTTQAQFDAMVSLAFNIGVAGFSSSSVLGRHKSGLTRIDPVLDFDALRTLSRAGSPGGTMAPAFGAWAKSGGSWVGGLFRRRMAEACRYRGDTAAAAMALTAHLGA